MAATAGGSRVTDEARVKSYLDSVNQIANRSLYDPYDIGYSVRDDARDDAADLDKQRLDIYIQGLTAIVNRGTGNAEVDLFAQDVLAFAKQVRQAHRFKKHR